jgi:hypothetical protein
VARVNIKFSQVSLGLIVASVMLTLGMAARAEDPQTYKESAAQRAACKPDVYRLCKWYIPSRDGITYCLHQNIDKLSPDCRAVIEGRLR